MRTRTEGSGQASSLVLGDRVQINVNTGVTTTTPYTTYPFISHYKVCQDEIHRKHPFSGGPLSIQHVQTTHRPWVGKTGYNLTIRSSNKKSADYRVGGRVIFPSPSEDYLPAARSEYAESLGPDAWARFSPGKPKVGLNQFLAELRDFPSLFRARLKSFCDLGNLYLNAQFGWRPFLSDLLSTYDTFQNIDKHIANLRNEQGKWKRRGGTMFNTSDSAVVSVPTGTLYLSNDMTAGGGLKTTATQSRCWFSGRFRYFISGLNDPQWGKWKSYQRIFGLDITPHLLWQITPWSWLADWCSNAGSVINNFSRVTSDHLAAKYAYIMLHETSKTECTTYATGRYKEGYSDTATYQYFGCSASCTTTRETKTRVEASPYGFGLSWDGFNPFQLSILAALGISRLRL